LRTSLFDRINPWFGKAFPANVSIVIEICPLRPARPAPVCRIAAASPLLLPRAGTSTRHFDRDRTKTTQPSPRSCVTNDRHRTNGENVQHSKIPTPRPWSTGPVTRRAAITAFGAAMVMANLSSSAISQSRSQPIEGATTMGQYAMSEKTLSDAVGVGGLLVVAQWEAKEGQADKVAEILRHFLPEAQNDPGAKLFLISRSKENPAQFLFYELFADEAAFKAHQESTYFKTYIAGQALPLLSKRERAQYSLL
jgi:quinol monooxygenase YgiN